MSNEEKKGFLGRLFGKQATNDPQPDETTKPVEQKTADVDSSVDRSLDPSEVATTDTNEDVQSPQELAEDTNSAPETDTPVKESVEQQIVFEDAARKDHQAAPADEAKKPKASWLTRLTKGLTKSSNKLSDSIGGIFTKKKLDDEQLEALEDTLIQADLGVNLAMNFCEKLAASRYDKEISEDDIRQALAKEIQDTLEPVASPLVLEGSHMPEIILMIGVNGSGKTTTIGKLAHQFTQQGKRCFLAAGDTFRAAAVAQLKIWAERTNSGFISKDTGGDAAGLVYDAIEQGRAQRADILLIDTAGRLQNKSELMAELEKIIRVIKKFDETAPHHVLLVLDATTGQNALSQVELFGKIAGVTGLVMTKLDGSARGGVLVAIADKYKLPIHAIGVGESIEDLRPFAASDFAKVLTQTT